MTKLVAFENVRQRPSVLDCERISATGLRAASSARAVCTENDAKSFILFIRFIFVSRLTQFLVIFTVAKKILRMRLAAAPLNPLSHAD